MEADMEGGRSGRGSFPRPGIPAQAQRVAVEEVLDVIPQQSDTSPCCLAPILSAARFP